MVVIGVPTLLMDNVLCPILTHRGGDLPGLQAVVEAVQHRLRLILLTASAAILGMIPIMAEVFWGPMAFAVVGGLFAATVLTVLFLPALYVAWFRVPETARATDKLDALPAH